MRWAGHVARMGNEKSAYSVLAGRPEGKRPLERPRCRGERTILKWIFKKWDAGHVLECCGSG